ncbi:hypothetical protein SAMN05661096_00078 [Marivirga sericea]|uniref:Uncharacterized protein n=1 Tax=Marivirga sericea TaxID=1028 RepID=A0A1X7I103_9BACT|nr:hypothetical protein [Marivirga sericea]SMG07796.1 hypothetical protein SAMN05661096_00078 [Marivirga sericea]
MMNRLLLLIAVSFVGCQSNTDDLPTQEFIDNVFTLEQKTNAYGDTYWQPDLNEGIREVDKYYTFFNDNQLALSYLRWNLIDERLPDSIKYSIKSYDEVQKSFQNFANQDPQIVSAMQKLIYPQNFRDDKEVSIDSLVELSAKLYYAQSAGEGKVGWTFCAGKSKFPEIYGESKSYESIVLQALCFQAVFEDEYSTGQNSVWDFFNQKIPEVSSEMNEIEYENYIDQANLLMWEKMSQSKELLNLMVSFTRHEKAKHYFQIREK